MATKESEKWMEWYHKLTENEKKEFNRKRYEKAKSNPEFRFKRMESRQKDTVKIKCVSVWHTVKNRPWCVTSKSPKGWESLYEWAKPLIGQPCKYCGQYSDSIDHIVPLAANGKHEIENLQVICYKCNMAKSDQPEEEFLQWLRHIGGTFCQTILSKEDYKKYFQEGIDKPL